MISFYIKKSFVNIFCNGIKPSILLTVLFLTSVVHLSIGQVTQVVNSSNGYQVSITINPYSIVPNAANCPNGVYHVSIPYNIFFSGSNIPPGGLYTLQGTIDCIGASGIFFDLPNNGGSGTSNSSNASTTNGNCPNITCSSIHITIQGPGISSQTINFSGRSLPIEITEFNVSNMDNKALINWQILEVLNLNRFELERSQDLNLWNKIQTIYPESNELQFQFEDFFPISPRSYYRLKFVDNNSNYDYSQIKVFQAGNNKFLKIHPNPVTSTLTIDNISEKSMFNLIDITGRKLKSIGTNNTSLIINIDDLKQGIYFLTEKNSIYKIIKTE